MSALKRFISKLSVIWYRVVTAFRAFKVLYFLPKETVDSFLHAYQLFDKEAVIGEEDAKHIQNYYKVLNELCAIGEVEKMYIPPYLDRSKGVYENQLLFEEKMMKDLEIKRGDKILDVGCGRGRIAAHFAVAKQADVSGINIDQTQLQHAVKYAAEKHLSHLLHFKYGNFNDPLEFGDEEFDALYQVQVLTYAENKEALFKEFFRVMKPGAKLSFLDWVKLEAFEERDEHHQSLLRRIKPLIGAVDTPSGEELANALIAAGFEVTFSGDISVGGHQADLIVKADTFYRFMRIVVHGLVKLRVFPLHFKILFDRLVKDCDAFIEADRLGLFTTSYQTIALKPAVNGTYERL